MLAIVLKFVLRRAMIRDKGVERGTRRGQTDEGVSSFGPTSSTAKLKRRGRASEHLSWISMEASASSLPFDRVGQGGNLPKTVQQQEDNREEDSDPVS